MRESALEALTRSADPHMIQGMGKPPWLRGLREWIPERGLVPKTDFTPADRGSTPRRSTTQIVPAAAIERAP